MRVERCVILGLQNLQCLQALKDKTFCGARQVILGICSATPAMRNALQVLEERRFLVGICKVQGVGLGFVVVCLQCCARSSFGWKMAADRSLHFSGIEVFRGVRI